MRNWLKRTPETYNAQIKAAIEAREMVIRAQQRQTTIVGNLNGLSCPRCGSPMGDLSGYSPAGGNHITIRRGTLLTASQWCGCSSCEYECWRISEAFVWENGFVPFDLKELIPDALPSADREKIRASGRDSREGK